MPRGVSERAKFHTKKLQACFQRAFAIFENSVGVDEVGIASIVLHLKQLLPRGLWNQLKAVQELLLLRQGWKAPLLQRSVPLSLTSFETSGNVHMMSKGLEFTPSSCFC